MLDQLREHGSEILSRADAGPVARTRCGQSSFTIVSPGKTACKSRFWPFSIQIVLASTMHYHADLEWVRTAFRNFSRTVVFTNHLVDVQIAAIVLFSTWLAKGANARQKQFGIYALALATVLAAIPLIHKLKVWDRRFQPHRFQRVIILIGDTHKPILAENPIIPVLAGQIPYVLDPWMLRMLRERIPNFGDPLLEGLRHQAFGAVVLSGANAQTSRARAWYKWSHFGPGFLP